MMHGQTKRKLYKHFELSVLLFKESIRWDCEQMLTQYQPGSRDSRPSRAYILLTKPFPSTQIKLNDVWVQFVLSFAVEFTWSPIFPLILSFVTAHKKKLQFVRTKWKKPTPLPLTRTFHTIYFHIPLLFSIIHFWWGFIHFCCSYAGWMLAWISYSLSECVFASKKYTA